MPPPKDPKKYQEWIRKQSDSHKGKITWMKGKKHSKESIEKNRISHIGKVHSEEDLKKMSLAHKGQIPWNAGKTGIYSRIHLQKLHDAAIGNKRAKGKKHSKEWKMNQSNSLKGKNNPFYNKKHNNETKLAISKANTGRIPWIKGKNHSEETRAKLKITRMHQVFPRKDSKPEKIMQIALSLRNVKYRIHEPIVGQPDIFIEPNICVFIDGDYWHNRPEVRSRDLQVNDFLIKNQFKVFRIWESEVKKDPNVCVDDILDFVMNY